MTHDPREAPQITMADIRKHTGEGMVSEQSVIDAANEVLKEIYTSPPPAAGQTERELAAQAALARVRKVRDGYADQAKFADVDQASYFREFVRRLDDAVNPKPSAPPWNGAALRREAPAPEGVAGNYSKDIERKMMEVADLIAATLDQPLDPRAWDHLLIYAPREALDRRLSTLNHGENHDAVLASYRTDDEVRERHVDRGRPEPRNANKVANEQNGNAPVRMEVLGGGNQGIGRPDDGGGVREAFVSVLASLAAAISLLERMPKAKKAAPSDTMFAIMLDDYRKALETGRPALSTPPAAVEKEADDWRDDPSADERWNAGLDFAMGQFCAALGVDPKSVRWDAATETLDGDVNAVIWNILRARFGEDWDDPATAESNASVEARLREALEHYAKEYCEGWCEQDAGCANFDHDCGGCLARRALSAVGDEAKKSDEAAGTRPVPSVSGNSDREQQRDTTGVTAGETATNQKSEGSPVQPDQGVASQHEYPDESRSGRNSSRNQSAPSDPTAERREIVVRIKADPGDGTLHPDLAHVLARGFDTMGWDRPASAAEDMIDAILAALDGGAGA